MRMRREKPDRELAGISPENSRLPGCCFFRGLEGVGLSDLHESPGTQTLRSQ